VGRGLSSPAKAREPSQPPKPSFFGNSSRDDEKGKEKNGAAAPDDDLILSTIDKYQLTTRDTSEPKDYISLMSSNSKNKAWRQKNAEEFYASLPCMDTLRSTYYADADKKKVTTLASRKFSMEGGEDDEVQESSTREDPSSHTQKNKPKHLVTVKLGSLSNTCVSDEIPKIAARLVLQLKLGGNSSLKDRAKVTEADSTSIEAAANKKIRDIQNYINNKKTIIRVLRAENSKILTKMRHITALQKILTNKITELNSTRLQQSHAIRGAGNRTNLDQITVSFMALNETEKTVMKFRDDLSTLKESQDSFQQKLQYNNSIITNCENEITQSKKELKIAVRTKVKFLLGLLKSGRDVR
jgi:uncharacterized protein YerC